MSIDSRFIPPVLFASSLLAACGGGSSAGPVAPPNPNPIPTVNCTTPTVSGGAFSQTTETLGLCYEISETIPALDIHIQGGGLALSDIDNDGFPDLYVTHGIYEKGRLFLGAGSGFVAAPGNNGIQPTGLDNAGYFIDIDSDGWDDFVSIQYATNFVEIFRNDGAGNFTEATRATGIFLRKPTYSVAAADYDLDGDIDLFFAHWGWAWREQDPLAEYLWENDGTGFYTDVSEIVEIKPSFRAPPFDDVLAEHSFTPTFADINSDGYPDILLAGDFGASQVLINEAGNGFRDITTADISDENGMGAAVMDYDRDGDLDWFVSSIYFGGREEDKTYQGGITGNRLYQNDGSGIFTDVTDVAGVRRGGWGWGSCFADFDNDGHADIFHTNGMRAVQSQANDQNDPFFIYFDDPSRLFMAQGNGSFSNQATALGVNHVEQGRGIICTDFDNDGRIDILVGTNGKSPTVFRNGFTNGNHYLQVDLDGPPGNLKGIGARVTVETADGTQTQEVAFGSHYLSQQPYTLHFGLGGQTQIVAVTVTWPGLPAQQTRLENVSVDQRLEIARP